MGKKPNIPIENLKTACYCRVSAERVWIYCRVDGRDTMALEMQQHHLERYAAEHGWTVAGVTAEMCNGLSLMRPGFPYKANSKELRDPFGIFHIILVSLYDFYPLGIGNHNPKATLLKDVERGNPVFSGGLHADV